MAQNNPERQKFSDEPQNLGYLVGRPKDEDVHMITESCLAHIESLLTRANETDKQLSRWDFLGKGWSASVTFFVSALGILITDYFDNGFNLPGWLHLVLGSIIFGSAFLSLVLFILDRKRGNEWKNHYKSFVDEALEILDEARRKNDDTEKST